MKKSLAIILALIMLASAFAGCGDKTPASPSSSDPGTSTPSSTTDPVTPGVEEVVPHGTFRSYFTAFPSTFNPLVNQSSEGVNVFNMMRGRLYNQKINETGDGWDWCLELAADWPKKMDDEGKVWQVTIRQDAVWANGEPITAHDFEYGYKISLDPDILPLTASTFTNSTLFHIVNALTYNEGECEWKEVGVKAIDDYTLEITGSTGVPDSNAIRFLQSAPLYYKPIFEAGLSPDGSATDYGTAIDKLVSSGPFILTEWIPDAKITLTRNPKWVRANEIKIEQVVYTYVPDSQTAIELFQSGQLDTCALSYSDWENFEDDPRVWEYFNDSLTYLFVNTGNPNNNNLLGNLDFRNALYFGIDRLKVAETIGVLPAMRYIRKAVIGDNNTGTPFQDIPDNYLLSAEDSYNVTLANEYLKKAYEACGVTASVTESVLLSETATHIKAVTEMLQKMYPEVFSGKLEIFIRPLPASQAQSLRRWNPDDPTAYDLALGSLLPDAGDPRDSFKFLLSTYSPPRFQWTSAEFDAIYDSCANYDLYLDADKIVEACQKMEKIIIDEKVIVPVYERPEKKLYAESIHLPVVQYITDIGFGDMYCTID